MHGALGRLDLAGRLLVTAALVLLTAGFAVSEALIVAFLRASGGGLGPSAITAAFHGDPTASVLKSKSLGSMRRYFSALENPEQLTAEEEHDLERVVAWAEAGAPEDDYWDPLARRARPGEILTIFTRRGCLVCHSPLATLVGNKKDSPLDSYPDARRLAAPDRGMDPRRLLMLTHVHLLGIGLVFVVTGALMVSTSFSLRTRAVLALAGPLGLLSSVGGWWATKAGGSGLSWLVLTGGVLMSAAFAASVLAIVVETWGRRRQPPA
jgi:hypothetical protein